jgi:hypothetical protein
MGSRAAGASLREAEERMLMIDDPEIERMIHDEASRTGEEPAEVLRRVLLPTRSQERAERPATESDAFAEQVVVRNGIPLVPLRPGEPPITLDLVRRLLEESA